MCFKNKLIELAVSFGGPKIWNTKFLSWQFLSSLVLFWKTAKSRVLELDWIEGSSSTTLKKGLINPFTNKYQVAKVTFTWPYLLLLIVKMKVKNIYNFYPTCRPSHYVTHIAFPTFPRPSLHTIANIPHWKWKLSKYFL